MNAAEHGWIETVHLTPPTLRDNTADVDRLAGALARRVGTDDIRIGPELMRRLPGALRAWHFSARCVLFRDRGGWVLAGAFDPGDTVSPLGAAIDLGTTRMAVSLVDLATGEKLAEASPGNPQTGIGPDVLSRIHHADREGGLSELQRSVVSALDETILDLCKGRGLPPDHLCLMALAGNTTMAHLFMGLEPRWIIREPYIPAVNRPALLDAESLGFTFNPGARVYVFPNIGSYFGGDVVAGILFSGLHLEADPALLVDVGTNAEVVCGTRAWMIACAGAAGPALEGGMSSIGMAAGPGAIDRIRIDPESRQFEVRTIAGALPKGICGSGVIDLAAQLFRAGMIDIRGRLVASACGSRYVERDGIAHLIVIPAAEAEGGFDLMIGQPELDSLVRSKAAMYTILETLVRSVGLDLKDIRRFFVAGTFGAFIDPASAITIGMLPDLPLECFKVVGNSSLGGALQVLRERESLDQVESIRHGITYLELNVNQEFMNRFSAAKFLPHTDIARFPSVAADSGARHGLGGAANL
ncbi:MAG: ASKHA domain-containing protein [Desulfobacterales bacterium]